ncbi:hypothetical protein BVRB_5g105180 [Beta vulgaris subsp. vulgaris]|nr:hypothetical protein BVRB_5g105180 [Beta vulgaris subsp. vulgaris]
MADEEQDRFALYHDFCRYSSSQEELLSRAKFAREDETFPDNDKSPEIENSGASRRKLDDVDDFREKRPGESAAADADSERAKNLGFGSKGGEVSGTKLEGICEGKREIEHQSKKQKVSPLVHCSGKRVIEGDDRGEEVVVSRGDLKVVMKNSLCSFVPESPEFTEKLDIEDGGDEVRIEGMGTESGGKKKLEFCCETEVVKFEEEEGIGEIGDFNMEGGDRGDRGGEVGGDLKQGDGTIMEEEEKGIMRLPRKRELPRSMFGLVWGEGSEIEIEGRVVEDRDVEGGLKEAKGVEGRGMVGNSNVGGALEDGNRDGVFEGGEKEAFDGEGREGENGNRVVGNGNLESGLKEVRMEGNRNGKSKCGLKEASFGEGSGNLVIGNSNLEGGLKEPSVVDNRDGKSKGDEEESIKCLLDVLRMLGSQKSSHDSGEIDIFETAKRCGMTFPRSRFLTQG